MRMRMRIRYPDGTVHEGKKDFTEWTDYLGITDFDFSGLRVHDVATDEGWWAFWSEMIAAHCEPGVGLQWAPESSIGGRVASGRGRGHIQHSIEQHTIAHSICGGGRICIKREISSVKIVDLERLHIES